LKLKGFRFNGTFSAGLAIAGNWDVAAFGTLPAFPNPTTAGTGATVGLLASGSNNARSIHDISGFFSEVTGQVGPVSVSHFRGYNGRQVTGWQTIVGEGNGASVSAGGTTTSLGPVVNLMRLIGC